MENSMTVHNPSQCFEDICSQVDIYQMVNQLPSVTGTDDFFFVAAGENGLPQLGNTFPDASEPATATDTNHLDLLNVSTLTAASSSNLQQTSLNGVGMKTASIPFPELSANHKDTVVTSSIVNEQNPDFVTNYHEPFTQESALFPEFWLTAVPDWTQIQTNPLYQTNDRETLKYEPSNDLTGLSAPLQVQPEQFQHSEFTLYSQQHFSSQQNQSIDWGQYDPKNLYTLPVPYVDPVSTVYAGSTYDFNIPSTFDLSTNFYDNHLVPLPAEPLIAPHECHDLQEGNGAFSFQNMNPYLSTPPGMTHNAQLLGSLDESLLASGLNTSEMCSADHSGVVSVNQASNEYVADSDSESANLRLLSPESLREAVKKRRRSLATDDRIRKHQRLKQVKEMRESAYRNLRPEKPKRDNKHPWVRVNKTTKGKTLRSARVNKFDPHVDGGYRETEHPVGDWEYYGTHFKYNKEGELISECYSTEEIERFIWHHRGPLTLWIQLGPSDAQRRMPTNHSTECRFEDCPARKYYSGKINVGHLQVAWDEQWMTYKKLRDPHHVAGFAHLYCMERFLDFPSICRSLDVRVDNRCFEQEPQGRFSGSLTFDTGIDVAHKFLSSCKDGTFTKKYPQYPLHAAYSVGAAKNHLKTLTCAMMEQRVERLCQAKANFLAKRGDKLSHLHVNLGDLEIGILSRLADAAEKRRLREAKHLPESPRVSAALAVSEKRPRVVIELDGEEDPHDHNNDAEQECSCKTKRRRVEAKENSRDSNTAL